MNIIKQVVILAALAAFSLPAFSVEIGTIIPGPKTVCDTQEQWQQVWDAHAGAGYAAAVGVMLALSENINEHQEPACGGTHAAMVVVRIIDNRMLAWPQGDYWTQFVEFKSRSGRQAFGSVLIKKGGT